MAGVHQAGRARSLPQFARRFLALESAGGIALVAMAVVAMAWANSPWPGSYERLSQDLHTFVNDGLMALFFFVVGLEIKREVVRGELADRRVAVLPLFATVGGVVVPACIYAAFTAGTDAGHGWGIPMATDIAFALGVLTLVAPRVPGSLKLLLLTLAVLDDIVTIVVIAAFYGGELEAPALAAAVACLAAAAALRKARVDWAPLHVVLALGAWYATYHSGVHATIAGVAIALVTPARLIEDLEARLHPCTSFLVLPFFALVNAGVVLHAGMLDSSSARRAALGVGVGLVIGKTTGILGGSWIAVRVGLAALPPGVGWRHLSGIAALGGIGFTVSLFVTSLAFTDAHLTDAARFAILCSSVIAAAVGALLLRRRSPVT